MQDGTDVQVIAVRKGPTLLPGRVASHDQQFWADGIDGAQDLAVRLQLVAVAAADPGDPKLGPDLPHQGQVRRHFAAGGADHHGFLAARRGIQQVEQQQIWLNDWPALP